MTMSLQRIPNVLSFAEVMRPWLLRHEIENNLILSILSGMLRSGVTPAEPYFAVVRRGNDIVGCTLRTPPHKLLVTRLPDDAVTFIVHDVGTVYQSLPAVLGPEATARTCDAPGNSRV